MPKPQKVPGICQHLLDRGHLVTLTPTSDANALAYVLTLSFLAHRAAPSMKSLCVPSRWSGETSVASSASPKNVSPSATTSKRRPSEFCGGDMSIQISEHHVGGHSCTAFPADLSHSTLHREPSPVVAKGVETGHTGRSEQTRAKTRFVGIDDTGPLCDLTIALSAGTSCGHTTCSRWWDSTETDACFCHPRASAGSLQTCCWSGPLLPMLPTLATALQRLGDVLDCGQTIGHSSLCFSNDVLGSGCLARTISRQSAQLPQRHPEFSEHLRLQHPQMSIVLADLLTAHDDPPHASVRFAQCRHPPPIGL